MTDLPPPTESRTSRFDGTTWPVRLAVLAVLALVAAAYLPGLHGGFVFDDFHNIAENPAIRIDALTWQQLTRAALASPSSQLLRPLAMLSFALNYLASGLDPAAMKATNIAIHTFNTWLVYLLVRRIASVAAAPGRDRGPAFALLTAAAWGLNPINLMAVLYTVQRMESLCHLFVFAGLWLYCVGRQRQLHGQSGWPAIISGVVGGTVLGAMSKESAVLLPLYAFLIELFVFRFAGNESGHRSRPLIGFYVAVLFVPALLGSSMLLAKTLHSGAYANRDFTLGQRLLTEPRILFDYLQWILVPRLDTLALYHDGIRISTGVTSPITTLLAPLAIIGLLAIAWRLRGPAPLFAVGITWFFAAHLLTGTFIPLELAFEHRNYFASLGALLALVELVLWLARAPNGRRLATLAITVLCIHFGITTALRAREWRNPLMFAETEARKNPSSPRAAYERARMLVIAGGYDPESKYTREAVDAMNAAMAIPESSILANQGALILAARIHRPIDPSWWSDMQEKLRERPATADNLSALAVLSNCAISEACAFPSDQMIATYSAALHRGPNALVLTLYGKYALYVLHDSDLTLRLWTEAADIDPNNPQFQVNLAMILVDTGRFADAQALIDRIRADNRVGVFAGTADELQTRLEAARRRAGEAGK